MRPPRRVLSALTASVLSVGLVACSGDSDSSADPDASTESSDSSSEPSADATEEPTTTVSAPPGAGPEVAPFLARLKEGFGDEGSAHVTLTMSGAASMSAEGDTSYGPDGSDMRLTMEMAEMGGEISMVVVDDQVFLSMPGLTPEGKYFQVPADSPALAGFDAPGLSPADSFAAFEAGLLGVEEKGEEQIDGATTQRYELRLDAERATAAMGTGESPAGLPDTLVYDLWLDEEDRMRRIEYAVAGTEVTMDMTEWGEVEPVTAPDASELVDAPEMAGP